MEDIGVVVEPCPEIGLGREVVPLLKGVYEHVKQRVHHKDAQEQDRRQQVQPALILFLIHHSTASAWKGTRSPVSLSNKNTLRGWSAKRT